MSSFGVLFSLSEEDVSELKSFEYDDDRLNYLQDVIEVTYYDRFPDKIAELDTSWDTLHRSLTNGKLGWTNGVYPLNHVILAGELLYSGEDYIMSLKTPEQVIEIAIAVQRVTKEDLKRGYQRIDSSTYGFPLNKENFDYTWDYFSDSKEFWNTAAIDNRYVLFTVDQLGYIKAEIC